MVLSADARKRDFVGDNRGKPVKLSFSLSFPYCSLSVHNFLRSELLALTEMLGVRVVCVPTTNRETLKLTRYVNVRSY